MSTRWSTGWVVLPGTTKTPGKHLHRPHPDRPAATCCDRIIKPNVARWPMNPRPQIPLCARCESKVSLGKARDKQKVRKIAENNRKMHELQNLVRRRLHGGHEGGSVRAVSAGLPGHGRRR